MPADQKLGTGDGTTKIFQLVKQYGANFDPYLRPITKPVADSVRVAVGGSEATTGWTVDSLTGLVSFATAPANGAALTAGFLFDVPVRFDTDTLDVELTSFNAADATAIPLIEVFE